MPSNQIIETGEFCRKSIQQQTDLVGMRVVLAGLRHARTGNTAFRTSMKPAPSSSFRSIRTCAHRNSLPVAQWDGRYQQQVPGGPHLEEVLEVDSAAVLVLVLVHQALQHPRLCLQVTQRRPQPLLLVVLPCTCSTTRLRPRRRGGGDLGSGIGPQGQGCALPGRLGWLEEDSRDFGPMPVRDDCAQAQLGRDQAASWAAWTSLCGLELIHRKVFRCLFFIFGHKHTMA